MTFAPEADFTGPATPQSYTVTDEFGLTAAGDLHVTVNAPPVAEDNNDSTPGGTLLTRDAANGVLPDDAGTDLRVTSFVPVDVADGVLQINADGSYSFQPVQHFHGTVTSRYTITDVNGLTAEAVLTITVTADPALIANVAPISQCVSDVPYLNWNMALPPGFLPQGANPLTITFINPDGPDYVVTGLALNGTMLWPGAKATAPKQWPGWKQLADGTYVETTGNYAWTRHGVQVKFSVNPEYTTTVNYPKASAVCASPGEELQAQSDLSFTGATAMAFVPWAAGLMVFGFFILVIGRRRREQD